MDITGHTAPPEPPSRPIVLASGSRYRRELLARLLPSFEVQPPDLDESPKSGESASGLARRLARQKAQRIARLRPEAIVIGSDQVAECDGERLGKPGSEARAIAQLTLCAGRVLTLHTAVHVAGPRGTAGRTHLDRTRLRFRNLSTDDIRHYVARDCPLDCAGSFRFESLGAALFAEVRTRDPTAIQGLPLLWLAQALTERGIGIL
jgi:septum formation protein